MYIPILSELVDAFKGFTYLLPFTLTSSSPLTFPSISNIALSAGIPKVGISDHERLLRQKAANELDNIKYSPYSVNVKLHLSTQVMAKLNADIDKLRSK